MATFTKFNVFTKDLAEGKHQIGTHVYKVLLSNTAPVVANSIKADLTEITAANGYTAGGPTSTLAATTASGVAKITATDVTVTASGGTVGPFRYASIYNDTQTSPAKPLVGFYDYGSSITLNTGEPFTVDFDGTNGFFTIT